MSPPAGPATEWDSFQRLTMMKNHWERPGWTEGRRAYYWYVAIEDPVVVDQAAHCQAALHGLPYLDHVPLDFLHLTLQRLAFADEISGDRVTKAQEVARGLCGPLTPLQVQVGPLTGSAGALRLSVQPWAPLQALASTLRGANEQAGINARHQSKHDYWPHIGISYCNEAVPAAPLQRRVQSLRDQPPVVTRVHAIDLVLLRRERRTYQWETLSRLALGTAPAETG